MGWSWIDEVVGLGEVEKLSGRAKTSYRLRHQHEESIQ